MTARRIFAREIADRLVHAMAETEPCAASGQGRLPAGVCRRCMRRTERDEDGAFVSAPVSRACASEWGGKEPKMLPPG